MEHDVFSTCLDLVGSDVCLGDALSALEDEIRVASLTHSPGGQASAPVLGREFSLGSLIASGRQFFTECLRFATVNAR
jgi:hypothetical protein